MSDIYAAYGPGSSSDRSETVRLARLQQAWYRLHRLQIRECGVSPYTHARLRSVLPEGCARSNFLSEIAYDYAEERLRDKSLPPDLGGEPDLLIAANRLRFNMLSSQPMCFNLFSDIRAEVAAGRDPSVHATVSAMFPEVDVTEVDSVVVEEVPPALPPISAYDKTGWDAAIRCNTGQVLITIETKYTDHLDQLAPTRGNDALFDIAERFFTKDGLDYYRELPRKPTRTKKGQDPPPKRVGGFDQLARNLLLTLRYAEAQDIATAVNYVLAPAFDTEAEPLVNRLRERLRERWRQHVQYRTLDDLIQSGLPFASPQLRRVLDDFTTRYLDLNPARQLLGKPTIPYPSSAE